MGSCREKEKAVEWEAAGRTELWAAEKIEKDQKRVAQRAEREERRKQQLEEEKLARSCRKGKMETAV